MNKSKHCSDDEFCYSTTSGGACSNKNCACEACDGFDPKVVIDTGRNGRGHAGSDCKEWCNIRDAGVGRVPSLATALEVVDAYLWLKTPGESDGCTLELPGGGQCQRYDPRCGSEASIGRRG